MTAKITHPDSPATEKQFNYLISLANAREVGDPKIVVAFLHQQQDEGKLTRQMASQFIESWKVKPQRALVTGYYSLHTPSGVIHYIHLVENRQKTGTYTKVLVGDPPKWTYDNSFKDRLHEAHKMTAEEIAHFGHITRRCLICAAELTDPDSVARGVGPVCAKRIA